MRAERKKQLRSLITVIPDLIKASLVSQAFEAEKVIASTFPFSEAFASLMANIPQNHIEEIQRNYGTFMFKAYEAGRNAGKTRYRKLHHRDGPELEKEIKVKLPMDLTLSGNYLELFKKEIGSFLKTVPNHNDIYVQFKKDLEAAWRDGIMEFMETLPPEEEESDSMDNGATVDQPTVTEESEDTSTEASASNTSEAEMAEKALIQEIEKWTKLLGSGQAEKVLRAYMGLPIKATAEEETPDTPEVKDQKTQMMYELEEYTKLIGTPESEKVLRAVLGLPITATASAKDDRVLNITDADGNPADLFKFKNPDDSLVMLHAKTGVSIVVDKDGGVTIASKEGTQAGTVEAGMVVGPYDVQNLKSRILSSLRTHKMDPKDEFQIMKIECLVTGLNGMSEEEAQKAIAAKLKLPDDVSGEEVNPYVDAMAEEINGLMNIPGNIVFDTDDDNRNFCLYFTYNRSDADELGLQTDSLSVANLPTGPQGVLTQKEQKEISALANLKKGASFKEIRKASPAVGNYLSQVLTDIRNSKCDVAEGGKRLRAKMEEIVASVFGQDGVSYFNHIKKK